MNRPGEATVPVRRAAARETHSPVYQKPLSIDLITADLLVAKYTPVQLKDTLLEGVFLSRWAYEQENKNPAGGRVFAADATPPSQRRITAYSEAFRPVFIAAANATSDRVQVTTNITYFNSVEWIAASVGGCGIWHTGVVGDQTGMARVSLMQNSVMAQRIRDERPCRVKRVQSDQLKVACAANPSRPDCGKPARSTKPPASRK